MLKKILLLFMMFFIPITSAIYVSPSTSSEDIKFINSTLVTLPGKTYPDDTATFWMNAQIITVNTSLIGTYTWRVTNKDDGTDSWFIIAANFDSCYIGCGQSWWVDSTHTYTNWYKESSTTIPNNSIFILKGLRHSYSTEYIANFSLIYHEVLPPALTSPTNGSSINIELPATTVSTNFTWQNGLAPYIFILGQDSIENEIVNTTLGVNYNVQTLDVGHTYYWKVIDSFGQTTNISNYTVNSISIQGRLNITVFDEQQSSNRIMIFNAQVYNSTALLNKSATNGWVNFSGDEISSGEYLIRIVPNSSYATRSVLATSPTNVTIYIPSTSNTINIIAFYLLDYTTMYPWSSSILTITKNNSIIHKSYFDADSKVGVYLIQGDNYGVTITNGNNIQNWGNYVPISSGNVQVVITGISVNATSTIPFIYNLSYSTNDITLNWSSNVNINNLTFTILKNNTTPVHQLTTTIKNGQSLYTVTDTNSTYYVYINVDKDNGIYTKTEVINYKGGQARTDCGLGLGCRFNIGTFIMPQWAYNNASILLIWVIAGSFGAWFAALGAIIAIILLVLFIWWGWLEGAGIGISLVGAIAVLVIIDYLKSKE